MKMELVKETNYAGPVPLISKNSDVFMAVAVVGILVFMVIPLPPMISTCSWPSTSPVPW